MKPMLNPLGKRRDLPYYNLPYLNAYLPPFTISEDD